MSSVGGSWEPAILGRMWAWVVLWVVLALGAGAVLGLLARMLWKKAKALIAEIGTSSERLTAVLAQLNDLTDQSSDPRSNPR
jgi:hypothetical protein